jgi:hypothetical protein
MAASDLHVLQAALSLPPERLGEVRCRAISRTPIPSLLGGLLSMNEVGQLSLRPQLPLKQWERCLRLSKNRGCHHFGRFTRPEKLLRHLQGRPLVHPPGRLLWELCRSHESGVNSSGRHVMGLSKFPDILSPAILHFGGHEAFVLRFLWSAAATVVSFTFSSVKTLISAFSSRPGHGRPTISWIFLSFSWLWQAI